MWAQTWENLYTLLAPYPDAPTVDVTQEMINQVKNKSILLTYQIN
jgi:peptidyl-dipeptidase A